MFVVIRHPELGLGTCPAQAAELFAASGWVVVSDERAQPSEFHLPDFADAVGEPSEPEPPAETTEENPA